MVSTPPQLEGREYKASIFLLVSFCWWWRFVFVKLGSGIPFTNFKYEAHLEPSFACGNGQRAEKNFIINEILYFVPSK